MTQDAVCKSILVVEDERSIRETLILLLETEGYFVVGAVNGQDALNKLEGLAHPCMVITDLMMPEMNGWEFITAMKKNHILATIPVVVITAAGDTSSSSNRKQVKELIKKPMDIDVLLRAVHQYCGLPTNTKST
jgi:CheY-like chemotaxis protein